jgi:high-affinity nickel-transport protein
MCLIDTIDGALMLSLYIQPAENFLGSSSSSISGSTAPLTPAPAPRQISRNPRDPIAFLYYSIVLTTLTVIVAIVIGVLQLLTMIVSAAEPKGKFWEGVEVAGEYYDVIGGSICGLFIVFGGLSVVVYPTWRRWVERKVERDFDVENIDQDQSAGVANTHPLPTGGAKNGDLIDIGHVPEAPKDDQGRI